MKKRRLKVSITASSKLPTRFGVFDFIVWKSEFDNAEHVLLRFGDQKITPVLTRIHSQCATSESFLSLKCDCREQLHEAMKLIVKEKAGMIIYLHQEGRGIGLANKIRAYHLQDTKGLDTVEANEHLGFHADERDYQPAIDLLHLLKITSIKLITNNPQKFSQLENAGIMIEERIPLHIKPNDTNKKYLATKKKKLGHWLDYLEPEL